MAVGSAPWAPPNAPRHSAGHPALGVHVGAELGPTDPKVAVHLNHSVTL